MNILPIITIFLILFSIDLLAYLTIKAGRVSENRKVRFILICIHFILSILTYYYILRILFFRGDFAENRNISLLMSLGFLIAAVWLPRIVMILFLNLGKLLKKISVLSRVVNWTGLSISLIVTILVLSGTIHGRFNFKYEEVIIPYNNLPDELNGFKIVQISDLHLSSFYKHKDRLIEVVEEINRIDPDIIVNTGDFVTIAWNEMVPFTDILAGSESKYGNFAIPGNHDAGTYHPYYDDKGKSENVETMKKLIKMAGYTVLSDSHNDISINSSVLRLAGVITTGSIPDIIYGDINKALYDTIPASFTILLTHDPNHWVEDIRYRNDIDLTLSGHTHGMQMGIITRNIKWSPAKKLYPCWNGLYGKNDNYLYVNRGLGTISFPFRIGMPPEITIITLIEG